jgi:hypothetical protein
MENIILIIGIWLIWQYGKSIYTYKPKSKPRKKRIYGRIYASKRLERKKIVKDAHRKAYSRANFVNGREVIRAYVAE